MNNPSETKKKKKKNAIIDPEAAIMLRGRSRDFYVRVFQNAKFNHCDDFLHTGTSATHKP